MAHAETEDFQLYFSRIRPIYHQLFNLAHAVTGAREQAEYALQYAMLECWSAGDVNASQHGFREGLRNSVIRAAIRESRQGECDWDELRSDSESQDPILRAIAQENAETRRLLALRYGCGFSHRRIVRATGMEADRVHTLLRRFEARTKRRLSPAQRRKFDLLAGKAIRSQMHKPTAAAPAMGNVFRTFQADASAVAHPSRLPARLLRIIAGIILAVFCIAAFWFTAVMMQPPVLEETPAAIVETK